MGIFATMVIMLLMLAIGIPCLIVGTILFVTYLRRKKRGERLRLRRWVVSIILFSIAGIMIVPPVGLVLMIRVSNSIDSEPEIGKVAQYYDDKLHYPSDPPYEAPYMIFEDKKYTNFALALSDYGDVLINLDDIKTTEPVADVNTDPDSSKLNRFLSKFFGGNIYTGTVSPVLNGGYQSMLYWDDDNHHTWPLYCPDKSLDKELAKFSDDSRYDYYYAVWRYSVMDEYKNLSQMLTREKKPLVMEDRYFHEITELLKSSMELSGGVSYADSMLIDVDDEYDEYGYAEVHIFSMSKDGLIIREHAVLVMKQGKLYQTAMPSGFDSYRGPQFISYEYENDAHQLLVSPVSDDIATAIIEAVGEDIKRIDLQQE
ncbi:MAG: hypothetical protein LBO70_01415 [Clostridiales Family XIII bacterium]|jgi:hypothetical protein|nr:hypothetical protein [Clostridiales Family XIII bacterium]